MVVGPAETKEQRRLRYLRRADEATKGAEAASGPELRKAFLHLAQSWIELVHEIDRHDRDR